MKNHLVLLMLVNLALQLIIKTFLLFIIPKCCYLQSVIFFSLQINFCGGELKPR